MSGWIEDSMTNNNIWEVFGKFKVNERQKEADLYVFYCKWSKQWLSQYIMQYNDKK